MLFLISILIALLPAQIEYRATSSQATVSTPAASHACVLQASLSADMQDALTAAFDAEAARYHLDNLRPGQRYFVQLLCDGKLADAATLTTEPDTPPVPAPQRPCDTAPREITASGEGAVLNLPVNPDCGKSLARQASWLRFHPHASDARIEVDPNPGAARQTSVYIGSEEVLVRQAAGTNCLFNLGSSWFPGNSASYSLTVPAPPGCAWSVTSAPEWLVLTSTTSGTGPGQIPYTLTTNGNSVRSGLLTLSTGQSFGLSQMPGACTGSGTSTSWFPFAGGTYTFHFTAPAGCGWTLAPSDNWVHVNSSLSGSGSSSVTFTLDPNIGPGRSAMIFVIFPGGSVTLTIQQPPYVFNGPCTYSVTYSNQPLQPYAGTPAIILNTQNGCPWTAVSNSTWAVVPLSAGYGPTVLPVAVAANTSPAARTATLVIGGQTVTLTQSGVICNLTFGSSGSFFPPSAGLYDGLPVFGQEGCPWNVSSTASFVQIASGPMSGSGTLAIFLASNPGAVRTATLTLAGGATFTVTQTGSPCGVFFAPSQSWFPASGGTYLLNIATGPNCPWSVSSLNPWIVAASSGAGPGQVSVTIQPNTTGGYRAGYVYAGTSSFRVDQVGQ